MQPSLSTGIVVHLGLTSAAPTSSGANVAPSACWRVRVSALRGCPDRVYQVAKREMPVAFYVADILPELAGWCPPADLKNRTFSVNKWTGGRIWFTELQSCFDWFASMILLYSSAPCLRGVSSPLLGSSRAVWGGLCGRAQWSCCVDVGTDSSSFT